ncbi:MAG TPA: hypothetical protein VHW65_13165 [Gemmatimonadales bacterium]|nr:hypothetical protein [Gemmatimonadales bacterium]
MRVRVLLLLSLTAPVALAAQKKVDITGTWRVDAGSDVKNGPREVVIRADSSASWGTGAKEIARWRLISDKIMIALGGEWETYKIRIKGGSITLSGGDLQKAVTLKRIGPPTPLPTGLKVPPDPDHAG